MKNRGYTKELAYACGASLGWWDRRDGGRRPFRAALFGASFVAFSLAFAFWFDFAYLFLFVIFALRMEIAHHVVLNDPTIDVKGQLLNLVSLSEGFPFVQRRVYKCHVIQEHIIQEWSDVNASKIGWNTLRDFQAFSRIETRFNVGKIFGFRIKAHAGSFKFRKHAKVIHIGQIKLGRGVRRLNRAVKVDLAGAVGFEGLDENKRANVDFSFPNKPINNRGFS